MKSPRHLDRVRNLPCCVTGIGPPCEAHHIRYPGITGVGKKSSDYFTIPLTPELHREFHTRGRREWELAYGSQIDHVTRTLKRLYP